MSAQQAKVTEAVAVFDEVRALDAAVEALRRAGFRKSDISLLATEDAVARKLGHRYERVEELEDDPNAPRTAYRTRASVGDSEDMIVGSLIYLPTVVAAGTVVASAGVVAAAVTGTAIAGALIGTVLARWLDQGGTHRQVHFHWSQGSVLADGLAGEHSAAFDRMYQDALDVDERLGARHQRAREQGVDARTRRQRMNGRNPLYVPRNWLVQQVIDRVQGGDLRALDELMDVLRRPYDEQPGREAYAGKRPEWARHKPGCSMLSCSS